MKLRMLHVVALTLALAALGLAQEVNGIITGRVEDTSSARIPGVTITITSPAIQSERTQITDENGNYRFQGLPPGEYVVKYELPGFKTLIREQIIVAVGKTVTINPQLEVATVAETVTVTGESPVVDLEQAKIGVNFNSTIKDSIVNARNVWSLLSVTPGIKTSTADVGGSTMGTQVGYSAYGISGQVKVYLDGVDLSEGSGGGSLYGDYGSWEEVSVSAAGNGPEMASAGTAISAVVRSGTNKFKGSVLLGYQKNGFQSDNITDTLRNVGITAGETSTRYTDWNLDISGPIKRDKLTFYTSFRNEYSGLLTAMRKIGGTKYVLPASGIAPALCAQLPCISIDSPDGAPQGGLFYTRLTNGTTKLSFQLNPRNQLTTTANLRLKLQPYRNGSGSSARNYTPETTYRQESWFHTWDLNWVSTLSNRTTLNVSLNNFGYYWVNLPNTEGPRITGSGDTGATTSYIQGPYNSDLNNRRRWHENIVFSHFFDGLGGHHDLKAGYTFLWEDYRGSQLGYPGFISYQFNATSSTPRGEPYRVTLYSDPVQWSQQGLLDNTFYISDKLSIGRRLTLNLGMRFDRYTSFLPEQIRESANSNPWASPSVADIPGLTNFGNLVFPKRTAAIFNQPVPRLSFIYDLFGSGRTAIKGSYGIFSVNPADDLSGSINDNGSRSATYRWDGTMPVDAAYIRRCLATISGCSVSQSNVSVTPIDANIKNGTIAEITAGVDQSLFKDWAVRANYVRKIERGGYGTWNRQYSVTDYRPFQYREPGRDAVLGTPDDQIVTAYERMVATRPSDPLVTYNPGGGDIYTTWEFEANKRFNGGWSLLTGANWTKGRSGSSVFGTDPNTLITALNYGRTNIWDWTKKLVLTYELPWKIQYNTTIKRQRGGSGSRTATISCNTLVPLGQTCAQAGGRQPTQGNISLQVEPGGLPENILPPLTLWDMEFRKTLQLPMERLGKFDAIFSLYNVTNANTITSWTTSTGTFTDLAKNTVPTFHRPTAILSPRIYRLSLKYQF